MRRAVAAVVLPLLVAVSACGSNAEEDTKATPATIADISVTDGPGGKPEVAFKAPITFADTEGKIIDNGPGKGDAVNDTSTVTVDYVGLNASDHTEFGSTWNQDDKPATFQVDQVVKGFEIGLSGAHAGDRVLIAVASADGYDPTGNGSAIRQGDSVVFVVDVRKVENPRPLTAANLPVLQLNRKDQPTGFKAKSDTPPSLGKLGVFVEKQGKGAEVQSTDTVKVNYLGQIFPAGEVFDESFSKDKPVSVSMDNVIDGWRQGLVGQPVGSRVILAVPSELAYGATGSGTTIPPDADLIFVIDILDAGAK